MVNTGKPLLVNDPFTSTCMSPSAVNTGDSLRTRQSGFAAFQPDIGQITTRDGHQQELFLRLNNASLVTKAYERRIPPCGSSMAEGPVSLDCEPEYQAYSSKPIEPPGIWPERDILSKSGLFTTPPGSPQKGLAPGRFPNFSRRQTGSVRTSTDEKYTAGYSSSQVPIPTYRGGAAPTPASKGGPVAYDLRPYTGKPLPRPILTSSVQNDDYGSVDSTSPEPEPESSPSPTLRKLARRFSFDGDAPDDYEVVERSRAQLQSQARSMSVSLQSVSSGLSDRGAAGGIETVDLDSPVSPLRPEEQAGSTDVVSLWTPTPPPPPRSASSPLLLSRFLADGIPQGPVPLPTTRYYESALITYGRARSRRSAAEGTSGPVGRGCDYGEPAYVRGKSEGEEWMVWD